MTRRIGVDARVGLLEGQTLIARLDGVPTEDNDRFHTRNLGEAGQLASFSDQRIDALLDTLILITDQGEARPLWREYQALMARLTPVTVLYYPRRLTGVRTRLNGVTTDGRGETMSVGRWWIAPARAASTDNPPAPNP